MKINVFDQNLKLAMSSDREFVKTSLGNGEFVDILSETIYKQMIENQIKYLYISSIDNLLNKLADPFLIGTLIKNDVDFVQKIVTKAYEKENVGLHVMLNEKQFGVVEYLYMSDQLKSMRDGKGQLMFNQSHTLLMVLSINALKEIIKHKNDTKLMNFNKRNLLIYNFQKKQKEIQSCVKLEKFFLDYYSLIEKQLFIEVDRLDEFAPIKNESGNYDTPLTAYRLYSNNNIQILKDIGFIVHQATEDNYLYIDPMLKVNKLVLKEKVREKIKGNIVTLPLRILENEN